MAAAMRHAQPPMRQQGHDSSKQGLLQRLQQLNLAQAAEAESGGTSPANSPWHSHAASAVDDEPPSGGHSDSDEEVSAPLAKPRQQQQQHTSTSSAGSARSGSAASASLSSKGAAAAAAHVSSSSTGSEASCPATAARVSPPVNTSSGSSGSTSTAAAGSSACRLEYFQPHDGYAKGCPAPPCFEQRVSTAMGIHRKMELRDGELESTLRLLCKVFDVETATVSLLTGERIYLVAACGALPVCVCPDRWGFCGWSFLNPNHELNVVENMEADARFSQNFFVVNEDFRLVFYVMAPLISSNGHRVGTLCIMGQQPRKFDATRGAILANLSELLVRQIERRWALQEAIKNDSGSLMRSADAYTSAVGFVDASTMGDWRLLHLNAPAVELLGVEWRATYDDLAKLSEGRHFKGWEGMALADLLELDMTQAAWQEAQVELTLRGVKGAAGTPAEGKAFDVTFRLASSDSLDEHAPFSVGVPSWLRESTDPSPGRNLFFMHLTPARAAAAGRRGPSQRSSLDVATPPGSCAGGEGSAEQPLTRASGLAYGPRLMPHKSPFPDLVIGPLLGKGGYGKVFRGLHEGQQVAVKVIERLDSVRVNSQGIPVEVALTRDMHHLGVARCVAWGIGQPDPKLAHLAAASGASPAPTCWMLQELCDKHTLVDAVVKGWFRTTVDPTKGGTHLRVVALTAYEVASAMAYIHSHGIAHLDLSGGNVLLTASSANAHGFAARVTDFGLARNLDIKARTTPGRYGTITHMAPETIRDGELSLKCDVYAWGVLLWEMLTGSRAWAGMTHETILEAVRGPWQLAEPPGLPPVLQELLVSALSKQPEDRPSFREMLPKLEWYLQLTRSFDKEQLELPLRSNAAP